MSKSDNQILQDQTLWFKVNVLLFGLVGSMFIYDYIGEKNINADQTRLISNLETRVSVVETKLLEKASYQK